MSLIYVETLPPLMVSAKVFREVGAAGAAVREAFDAARLFAKRLLPAATARFDTFDPLFVSHCDTLLVILFDKAIERFWIAAFYYDRGEPTPPDGPPGGSLRQWHARKLLASLGLLDSARRHVAADRSEIPAPADDLRFPPAMRALAARGGSGELPMPAFRRESEYPPQLVERDLPKSRSNCFWPDSTTSCHRPTTAPLDDPERCVFSGNRTSGALFSGHPVS